jgi:hypothetical protein
MTQDQMAGFVDGGFGWLGCLDSRAILLLWMPWRLCVASGSIGGFEDMEAFLYSNFLEKM